MNSRILITQVRTHGTRFWKRSTGWKATMAFVAGGRVGERCSTTRTFTTSIYRHVRHSCTLFVYKQTKAQSIIQIKDYDSAL